MPFQNQKKFRTENTEYTERTQREHREMPWGCLGRRNFIGHRGVTEGTPRYNPEKSAFPEPSQRNRPTGSRPHELSLVFPLCSQCPPCEPCFLIFERTRTGVSRRREKKERLRRDARIRSSRGNQRADFGSPRSLAIPALERLRTPDFSPACLFFSGRALPLVSLSSVFSVPSVRTLFFKTYTKAYRALAKKRDTYAAMTSQKPQNIPI